MIKEIEFLVIIVSFILIFYYFIRICILHFKNKKKDIDRFERMCNVSLINGYMEKLLIVNIVSYIISKVIKYLGG